MLITAVLGRLVWHSTQTPVLDAWVLREFGAHSDAQFRLATDMAVGLRAFTVGGTLVTAFMSWVALRRPDGVLLSLLAPTITFAAVELLLKPLVARQAPGSTLFNYPSGHVAVVTSLALSLVLIVSSAGARPAIRALAGLFTGLFVLVMGWVRLFETAHFLSDVVGGVASGAAVTLMTALLLDKRFRRTRAQAGGASQESGGRSGCSGCNGRLRNRDPSVAAASELGGSDDLQ